MKKIYISILGSALLLLSSCVKDLDQYPHIEATSANVYTSVDSYRSVLAKLYASYVIAGQVKGGGDKDLSSNNGYDYLRSYFNLQECGTDEVACTWLSGDKVANLSYLSWDANDSWVSDMYYRIYYTIAICNEFLRNATDDKISKFSATEQATLKEFRNEARFLRALAYSHALDFYGNIPFVTEANSVGAFIPPVYTRAKAFEFVESELKAIEDALPSRTNVQYGRASQAAAWTLLAKLYLNAEVYTGTKRYDDCAKYCDKVLGAGYSLEPTYSKLFNADNHKRTNEIIFSFAVDATHTVSWGATTYIVCGAITNSPTDKQQAAGYSTSKYGCNNGWGMFRSRGELPALFGDVKAGVADKRAMFFSYEQSQYLDNLDNQTQGYFVEKWTNLKDDGQAASNTASDGVSTDFPMFRLADVYLMYAEAALRGASTANRSQALNYVNLLRDRAYGSTAGRISDADLTLNFILDERGRELYWECTRRTDLVRFGKFTSGSYIWQWKGGVKDGKAVDEKYNIYPIPSAELTANPNLKNEKY